MPFTHSNDRSKSCASTPDPIRDVAIEHRSNAGLVDPARPGPLGHRAQICTCGVVTRHHAGVELRSDLRIDDAELRALATRHGVRRIAAFGSVLREDFSGDSDVDLLVEFVPGRTPGLLAIAAMEIEFGELFGREVELRTVNDLSRYFRDEVAASARELYAA